jgi:hypothetical protein
VAGTDFDYAAMVICVGVNENRLGMDLGDHFIQVGEHLRCLEAVPLRRCCSELSVGFYDANNLDLWAVLVLAEESVDVAVNQADNCNSERSAGLSCGVSRTAEQSSAQEQQTHPRHDPSNAFDKIIEISGAGSI